MTDTSKKRAERLFSYSPPATDSKKAKMVGTLSTEEQEVSQEDTLKQIFDAIQSMGVRLENRFEQLQIDMDSFRHEMKENVKGLKATANTIEKSLEEAWARIDDHTSLLKAHKDVKDSKQKEIDMLKSELQKTTLLLNVERKNNIALENYTRREIHEYNWKAWGRLQTLELIPRISDSTLYIESGNPQEAGKTRPIIARFVCREDRERVWAKKAVLKGSAAFQDAYITQDYTKAIQQEHRTLIKAMKKAKELGLESKVIDCYLIVGHDKYTWETIPERLKEDPKDAKT